MERITILIIAMLLMAPRAFALDQSNETEGALEIHRCTNNPFTRSVGFFRGRQPEVFLKAPHTRNEPPPQASELTRVMDVSRRRSLSNPTAEASTSPSNLNNEGPARSCNVFVLPPTLRVKA